MPYRIPDSSSASADSLPGGTASWDDLVLGVLLLLVAGPRVVMAFSTGERFSAEPSLAAVGCVLGLFLLVTAAVRRRQ